MRKKRRRRKRNHSRSCWEEDRGTQSLPAELGSVGEMGRYGSYWGRMNICILLIILLYFMFIYNCLFVYSLANCILSFMPFSMCNIQPLWLEIKINFYSFKIPDFPAMFIVRK